MNPQLAQSQGGVTPSFLRMPTGWCCDVTSWVDAGSRVLTWKRHVCVKTLRAIIIGAACSFPHRRISASLPSSSHQYSGEDAIICRLNSAGVYHTYIGFNEANTIDPLLESVPLKKKELKKMGGSLIHLKFITSLMIPRHRGNKLKQMRNVDHLGPVCTGDVHPPSRCL